MKGNGKFVVGSPKASVTAAAKGSTASAAPKVPAMKTTPARTPTKSGGFAGKKSASGVKLGNH